MENLTKTKQELDSIIWGQNNELENIQSQDLENSEVQLETNEVLEASEIQDNVQQDSDEKTANENKKKRNVMKFGNKDWVNQIKDDQKLVPGETIIHINEYGFNKFGIFKSYGKKETSIIVDMFKTGKTELMSREWALRLPDVTIVKYDNLSEIKNGYVQENGVYYTQEQFNKKNENKLKKEKNKQTSETIQDEINEMPEAN